MQTCPLGRTGLEVTPIGFGAAEIGFSGMPQEQVTPLIRDLIDEGINFIDTASAYRESEARVGQAIKGQRDRLLLLTKCAHPSEREHPDDLQWKAPRVKASVERSLQRLGTDVLDVVFIHSVRQVVLEDGEPIEALLEAQRQGKVRHIGYSGDGDAAAFAANLDGIDVVETSISPFDQHNIDRVLPITRRENQGVLAKRPIANAAWAHLDDPQALYTDRLKAMNIHPRDFDIDGDGDENKAWVELSIRFTMSVPNVHAAIIGTTQRDHARQNLQFAAAPRLPNEVMEHIRRSFHDNEPKPGEWKPLI